jgi:hypothetical protein
MSRNFDIISNYISDITGSVVEIGSERGGGSTAYLYEFCKKNRLKFYTVDFEEGAYERAKKICGENAYFMSGQWFLDKVFPEFDEKIGFAYLDNFDYQFRHIVGKGWILEQIELYKSIGLEMNNYNSKMHHLEQVKKIAKLSTDNCLIMLDDTWEVKYSGSKYGEACYDGKGGFAVSYLLSHGFEIFSKTENAPPRASFVLMRKSNNAEKD